MRIVKLGLILPALFAISCVQKNFTIETKPEGADIYLDGKLKGQTPKKLSVTFQDESEVHELELEKEGYFPEKRILDTTTEEYIYVKLLPKEKTFYIKSEPEGADVYIDKDYKGQTPVSVTVNFESKKEKHVLEVRKEDYKPVVRYLTVKTPEEVSVKLKPSFKVFKINSTPSKAIVYLDGQFKGLTPLTLKVIFKSSDEKHILKVEKYNYKPATRVLSWDSPTYIHITLKEQRKKKLGYFLPSYTVEGLNFKIKYEYGYRDTIETSPNALQVKQIASTNNVNQIIGNLDVKNGKLIYTQIVPKIQINAAVYIQYLETIKNVIQKVDSLLKQPSPEKARELYSYIKANEKILGELAKYSRIFGTKIDIGEVIATLEELSSVLSNSNFGENVSALEQLNQIAKTLIDVKTQMETIQPKEFYSELWMVDLKRGFVKTKLTDAQHKWVDMTPSLSWDGRWVYFSSNRLSEVFDIWRIGTQGGRGITKITFSRYTNDLKPSVDEKNTLIAYTSIPVGSINPQIWTVKTDGTLPSQLRIGEQPDLCRDGKKIVFVRKNRTTGKYQIWVMNSDGTGETILSQDPNVNDMYPHFSPDCKWIAFTSDAGGNKDIYIMKVDGSQRTQLTTNPSVDIYPVWADDGNIYFVSNRGLIWGIWSLKPSIVQSQSK